MRTRRSFAEQSDVTDINISPLIDMVFILLIFFIVTTVFVEESGLGVNKPAPASTNLLDKKTIVLSVTGTGQVLFEGMNIGVNGVRSKVRQLTQKEKIPVVINVEKGSVAGLVVRVIDEAKLGGAENISLSDAEG